jgi:hypothetical protein
MNGGGGKVHIFLLLNFFGTLWSCTLGVYCSDDVVSLRLGTREEEALF